MIMTEQAIRIKGWEDLEISRICYWKADDQWMIYLPRCGAGNLKLHTVIEHEDETITVTPSILNYGHDYGTPTKRHGYLTKGIWREV